MPKICEGFHALHIFPGAVRTALCWDVTQGTVDSGRLSRRGKEKRMGPHSCSHRHRGHSEGPGRVAGLAQVGWPLTLPAVTGGTLPTTGPP